MRKTKGICILLAVLLIFSVIPVTIFAADDAEGTNEIAINSAQDLLDNLSTENAVLKLQKDITLTEKVTINNSITIDGNGHNIYGQNDDATVYFEILGGTFTIKNATVSKFGGELPTQSRMGVFKVPETASSSTKVIASDLTITDYVRSAFDISSGSFDITNCKIKCENTYSTTDGNELLTKGILAGIGSNKVVGTVENTKIYNSESKYDEWTTSGIEVYNNAEVTVNNCEIVNLHEGISVDNYYYDTYGNIDLTVKNTNISVGNKAVRIYSKENTVGTANIDIQSGKYTGDIGIINKSDKDTIEISGGTFVGEVGEEVILADGVMLEKQSDGSYIARVDNSELKAKVEEYSKVSQDGYYEDSWNNFKEALQSSKELLNNINASKADLDKAVSNLTNTYNNLKKIPDTNIKSDMEVATSDNLDKVIANSDKVLSYIDTGKDVETEVTVNEITPTDDEKKMIEDIAKDLNVAQYFDISILIKDKESGNVLDEITNLSENVKFTVALNDVLKNVPEGYERQYKIIRIHDGKAEILDATVSEDGNYLEFSTDKFSTYAISYTDTKIEDTNNNGANQDKDIVQTGDYIYIAIGTAALVIIANIAYVIRKKRK